MSDSTTGRSLDWYNVTLIPAVHIAALLAFGEGWHNNHHAFPRSARHGMQWWEFDLTYQMVRGLKAVGLARDLRVTDHLRPAKKAAWQAAEKGLRPEA